MTIEFVAFALGALFLLTGILGGGFELRELKIPRVGWIARTFSTVAGVVLILLGIGMSTQSLPENPEAPPAAATFRIIDELGDNQLSEQVIVLLDGKRVGNLTVSAEFPYSEMTVTVPEAGQYSYTVEATAYFSNATTGKVFSYTGVGQGMIRVDEGTSFRLAGSTSGNSWVVTLVEFE